MDFLLDQQNPLLMNNMMGSGGQDVVRETIETLSDNLHKLMQNADLAVRPDKRQVSCIATRVD